MAVNAAVSWSIQVGPGECDLVSQVPPKGCKARAQGVRGQFVKPAFGTPPTGASLSMSGGVSCRTWRWANAGTGSTLRTTGGKPTQARQCRLP